jgi:molybdenum cofactor cytidylyltransferase
VNPALDAILLAAGESRRMGYPKPLLKVGEQTFIEKLSIELLRIVPRLIVVLGAHADRIAPMIPAEARIVVVENPDYRRGQLSSIKAGLSALREDAGAAMVHLCDHPLVRPETFAASVAAYEQSRKPIVIARSSGRRGHPVIFDSSIFRELRDAPEEQGARFVVNADPERVFYAEVADPGVYLDLDTPDDLLQAGLSLPTR